jgi:hypothetical protein
MQMINIYMKDCSRLLSHVVTKSSGTYGGLIVSNLLGHSYSTHIFPYRVI